MQETIDAYDVEVGITIRKYNIDFDTRKRLDDIIKLIHILIAIGINNDKHLIELLSDTLVGLGLTVMDGQRLVEGVIKDIQRKDET